MKKIYLNSLISINLLLLNLSGCSQLTSPHLPHDSITMREAYNSAINSNNNRTTIPIQPLQFKINNHQVNTQLEQPFPVLPNPMVTLYIYPHLAGTADNVAAVPGYLTTFPLYTQVYYRGENI